MTNQEITRLRLINQHIARAGEITSESAVLRLGAMQAQDYGGSLWAIGLRTGKTQAQVVGAIESKRIVRTWPQRGTLHFVPGRDARWLVALSAERLLKGAKSRRENLGLNDEILEKSRRVITLALKGGAVLTRPEMTALLENAGISTGNGRGYHVLWYLSQSGVTFVGPMKGKQQTIGLLADAGAPTGLGRAESLAEHAKRYFMSHGPATLADFVWWSGLTAKDARIGLAANDNILRAEIIDGKEYWMSKRMQNKPSALDRAYLLPGFDEYMLGYKDRSAALPHEHTQRIVPGGNGMFLPTIIIRGQVVGTWKRTVKKSNVIIKLNPFTKLSADDAELLQVPAAEYGDFLELAAKLQY